MISDLQISNLRQAQRHLAMAAKDLRGAWKCMKDNGMDTTAAQMADTVLDVEAAVTQIDRFLIARNVK